MHRIKSGKTLSLLLVLVMVLSVIFTNGVSVRADEIDPGERLQGVEYKSQEEIKEFLKNEGTLKVNQSLKTVKFAENPDTSKYTKVGSLTSETQEDFIKILNSIRYISGLDYNVTWDDSYAYLTQAASLVMYANKNLSHTPAKPAGVSDDIYNDGYKGASSSNIAMGYNNAWSVLVNGWMHDGDNSNIDRCGHRRWILNPSMGRTAVGFVGRYSAMYAFDNTGAGGQYGVAWPAQNMPVEYFASNQPWTYSQGTSQPASEISVTVKSKSSGKTWTFSQKGNTKDGYFNVENTGYGTPGCVIFRPTGISVADGQSYDVTINGLTDGTVNYTVNFFSSQEATEYIVKYDTQGGGIIADKKVNPGASIQLPTPSRSGYTFDGWYTEAKGGTVVRSPYTPSGNVTLYAHWNEVSIQNLTVSYTGQTSLVEGSKIPKSAITVKAKYSDGTTKVITDYDLSQDTIVTGKNTIVVYYDGKEASFTVTGTAKNKNETTKEPTTTNTNNTTQKPDTTNTNNTTQKPDTTNTNNTTQKPDTTNTNNTTQKPDTTTTTTTNETTKKPTATDDAKAVREKGFSVRLYNKATGDHIYTANITEAENLIKQGWNHETRSDGKNSFKSSTTKTGEFKKAVYCVYNPNNGGFHLYTFSKGEANQLIGLGWKDIYGGKPAFYVSSDSGKRGIYRAYNPNSPSGQQHYCIKSEYNELLKLGWKGNNSNKPYWYTD